MLDIVLLSLALYLSKLLITVGLVLYLNVANSIDINFSNVFNSNLDKDYSIIKLLYEIIISPIIETIIFFHITHWISRKIKISANLFIIFSAIAFSIPHVLVLGNGNFQIYYLLYSFFGGLIFAYNYNRQYCKYNANHALGSTLVIHIIGNALVLYL
jgi:hypothetical protein